MATPNEQPAPAPTSIPINLALKDIYDCLCPSCRDIVLTLISKKAEGGMVRQALQRQLEAKPDDS